MFGQQTSNPNKSNSANSSPHSLFSGNSGNNNPTGGLFGGTSNAPSMFGGPSNTNAPGLFGNVVSPIQGSSPSGLFSSGNLFSKPSPVSQGDKGPQAKPKENAAFNFFPPKQNNQQQADKKPQMAPQSNLFSSSTMFGPPKTQGVESNKLTAGPNLFLKKNEVPSLFGPPPKKQEKTSQPGGLFNSTQQQALFPSATNQSQKISTGETGKPSQTKQLSFGNVGSAGSSLFGNPSGLSGGLFDKKSETSVVEQKPKQGGQTQAGKPMFGGFSSFGNANDPAKGSLFSSQDLKSPTPQGPALFDNTPKQTKQADKKPAESQSGLFTPKPKQSMFPDNKISLSFGKPTVEQNATINKPEAAKPVQQPKPKPADQIKILPTPLFGQTPSFKQTEEKAVEPTPTPAVGTSMFKRTQQTQKTEQLKAPTSLFGQQKFQKKDEEKEPLLPTFKNEQNKQTGLFTDISSKSNKMSQNVSTNLPETTRMTNLSSDAAKTLTAHTQRAQTEKPEVNTSKLSQSGVMGQRSQESMPKMSAKTTAEQPNQSFLSSFKPKQIAAKTFVDYKSLREEEKSETFDLYLSQKRQQIIQSVKIYFNLRLADQKLKEVEPTAADKDRFYTDITNLFIKLGQLEARHYAAYQKFIRRVMAEEKYEQRLFADNKFNQAYFIQNRIYIQDYSGQLILNQASSLELRFIMEKLLAKWNLDKVNYLNFIFKRPDIIRPKEDLYSYLLTHLLRLESSQQLSQESSPLKIIVRDYNRVISKKLVELLGFFNQKLGRNYKHLLTEQPEKFIISLLPLIERIINQNVISLSLKIILNCLNLNQPEKIDKHLFKAIRQTKSSALLPLRVILIKLKQKKLQFAPSPKDLYKYISGDEWVDWIDNYLTAGDRSNIELNLQETKYLIQALSTISGNLLIDRLITARKGIYKLFDVLKEQNQVQHYYRILQSCLYNEQSIKQIDQFYFKKTYFSTQYQQIKEYVLNFHQNIVKPNQEVISQQNAISTLYPKISLLTKIIEIEPEKLFDLEKYIFDPEFSRNKKVKIVQNSQQNQREGHKLAHFFIDIINIVSVKWLQTKILAKIFRVVTALLKNKRTEQIMITVMSVNKPSFNFIDKAQLPKQTNQALGQLLDHIVSSSYLYDLIINSSNTSVQSLKMQLFYPFRYNSTQYCKLMSVQQQTASSFSIFWINQLFIAASKQRFNPSLLHKLLSKLNIVPSPTEDEVETNEYGIKKYRRCERKIPKVFEMIVNLSNSFSIWEEINKVLEYKIVKDEGVYKLINKFNHNLQSLQHYNYLVSTLKLLRTVFTLNQMLLKCQFNIPNHFITKTLSSLNILNKIEISSTMSLSEKSNILLALIANIQTEQPLVNDTIKNIVWQVQQQDEDNSRMQTILNYIKRNRESIDFQQVTNIVKNPQNMYYESQDNVTTLSLECIVYFLRLSPDSYFQISMLNAVQFSQEQKLQMRSDIMKKIGNTLTFYFSQEEYRSIRYKFLQFIYDLKYNLGKNKFNQGLADTLFADFLNTHRHIENQVRLNYIILHYLEKDLSQNKQKFDSFVQQIVLGVINSFQLRDSHTNGNLLLRDTKEIGNILLKYHQKDYSYLSFNQMERIIDEKAIIEIGQNLQTLFLAFQILIKQVNKKKYSHSLSLALNAINRLIAEKNLILLINDIPFEYFNLPKCEENEIQTRSKRPRQFLRDPLELFLAQGKSLQQKHQIQQFHKNNIIQWFMQISQLLSERLAVYLQFALTINKTFYSNNPIDFDLARQDIANKDIFCHLSLGSTALSAVQIFGKSEADAVGIVQLMSQNLISRLIILHQTIKQSVVQNTHDNRNYLQGLKLLGFCLQWLRNKRKGEQSGANDVVRKINRNHHILLPVGQKSFIKEQLKLIQSYLSIGEHVTNHIKFDIQHHLYQLIDNYHNRLEELDYNNEELGFLTQQTFTLLILCPPASNQQGILRKLVSIWSQQKNPRYFFNQSRLILQLASLYPQEMAKLRILSQYQLNSALRPTQQRYLNDERTFDSMKWIWALHIATALVSSSDSVLAIDQVSSFVTKNKLQLYKTLEGDEKRITRAYAEQLQATLNLFSILLSNSLWITKNSTILQEVTYIMSQSLIKYFVGIAQGKILPFAQSTNQKVLDEVKVSTLYQDTQMVEEYQSDHLQSIFDFEIKVKTIYCLRFYLIAMEIAFFKSHYIQKHFVSNVFGTSRYLSSFWDSFSKDLIVLFNFTVNRTQQWLKIKRVRHIVQLMNNCYNAPHTFIQNGFLTSIIQLPQSENEIFSDLYLLCFLVTKLAVTHYMRMRTYINKFNAMITSQNEKFGTRIKEHILRVGDLSKKLGPSNQTFISYQNFRKQAQIIDTRTTLK